MFETLSDRLTATFKNLRGKGRLSDADIDATAREIRVALLEADVALPVVRQFISAVKERARGAEVHQALNPAQQVIKIVNEELIRILGGETRRLRFAKTPPTVIMLAGLQGSGKTTLAGKLAKWLKDQGHQPVLVAADLQRPNAVQQLQVIGERAGVPVFAPAPGNGVGDPVEVARQSIEHARAKLYDVVIIDTAGRLGIDEEMMKQAADIRDAVRPDEILFVVDAMIGQDAVTTAQAFLDGVGFDGVVLTKLDGDARGGAALSVAYVTGRQVMFASNGEKLDDFDVFHPDRMASRILGMGDVLTLIEQAEKAFDAQQAEEMARKLAGAEQDFTLEDFLQQMEQVRKLGSISKLLGMLPGMNEIRDQINQIDDRELDRIAAIIKSMTPAERRDPKILNASRRARIARGSGTQVSDVNQLVERFFEARKFMNQMARGAMPGLPGMPGLGRGKKAKGKAKAKKAKARSGNPARREAEIQAALARQAEAGQQLPANFQLPKEFKDFLPPQG
ncbi:signal recognition particle protein [Carbonactinospora thermoautotrophica]|uniref:signal recognition particle protein n=1 Tax=Carbonactinospora thermoautotrophica TaxID=1469144 RepID=UPI00226D40DA|nr:signal recognition particle protein [Carbonactinospora thermoautotrophica]MCX9191772.1 signal recognition particle protein [Carbonactinospora thermoautotrophica]